MEIKAVLFDIDNTLILFNELDFFKDYFKRVTPHFSDWFDAEDFGVRLMSASRALTHNNGQQWNVDYFLQRFKDGESYRVESLWKCFESFYQRDFDSLKVHAQVTPGNSEVISTLKAAGLKLVAASNPLWPLAVQKMRLVWGDLNPTDFDFFTGIENSRYMKPQAGYFLEVAKALDIIPEHCLMVGNDPLNDMAAKAVGMRTYLTTDSEPIDPDLLMSRKIHAGVEALLPPDGKGPLAEVLTFVDEVAG
ncbi:HAD family hydrolase [bacterium]|nr:HAD family hydrolase [bacterium]